MNGDAAFPRYAAIWDYGSGVTDGAAVIPSSAFHGQTQSLAAYDVVKRAVDVVCALLGIAVTLPIWAVIAVAIKLNSKGPVLFAQERAGLQGRPFRMFKFRSMVLDAEQRLKDFVRIEDLPEPVYKLRDDPRVTVVGRILRRFGLDELPQLLNVLHGEMSLVGPRPEVVTLVRRYNAEQGLRLLVKPGITGYQQIHNRGMPDMAARLAYDLHYLRNRSIWLDFRILVLTPFVIASGKEITY